MAEEAWRIEPAATPLRGAYEPPGDRQMTHLALVLGALAVGTTHIQGALESPDTVSTRRILAQLGVSFTMTDDGWLALHKQGDGLSRPAADLDAGRSFSALCLFTGLLAGQKFSCVLTGDEELRGRAIGPLAGALTKMGAQIELLGTPAAPLRIKGQPLRPVEVEIDPAWPEVRDSLITAALSAVGVCRFTEVAPGPDHAERLLRHLGVSVRRQGLQITLKGEQRIYARRVKIPGDFTAAAPLIAAATLLRGSELAVTQVGTNPGRTGLLKTLARIGGEVEWQRTWQFGAEPVASFTVRHAARLSAFNVAPNLTLGALDELPLLALLATQAEGTSHLRSAAALQREVPDVMQLATQILRAFGGDVELDSDGWRVRGPCKLMGAEVQCAGDVRLVMLAAAAALVAEGPSVLHGADSVLDYYPQFFADLAQVQGGEPPAGA